MPQDLGKLGATSNSVLCYHLSWQIWTTFKARTYVQPQFQQAVLCANLKEEAVMAPEDHILVREDSYFVKAMRDTTGRKTFYEKPLPTREFPSDHAIVAAELLF